jgi:uncharacterized coiled-coil DUF342 family protein
VQQAQALLEERNEALLKTIDVNKEEKLQMQSEMDEMKQKLQETKTKLGDAMKVRGRLRKEKDELQAKLAARQADTESSPSEVK